MRLIDKIYKSQGIQGLLTIGYMYIVVLGIIGEASFYSQLGINILNYSSITDVLLSPISKLTANSYFLMSTLAIVFITSMIVQNINTQEQKDKIRNILYKLHLMSPGKKSLSDSLLVLVASLLFGFYVGVDWGRGASTAKDLQNSKLKYSDKIFFNNNDSTTHTAIVGVNHSYVFHTDSLKKDIIVSPISAIKSIEKTNHKLNFSKLFKKKQ